MKKFLSKILKNELDNGSTEQGVRKDPVFSEAFAARRQEETVLLGVPDNHPDETFLELETVSSKKGSQGPLEKISKREFSTKDTSKDVHSDTHLLNEPTANVDPYKPESGFKQNWLDHIKGSTLLSAEMHHTTLDLNRNNFLHYAAAFGKSHYLKKLIEHGWSINKKNCFDKTPFDFALEYGNRINAYFMSVILIERGYRRTPTIFENTQDLKLFMPEQGFKEDWLEFVQENTVIQIFNAKNIFDAKGNSFFHYAAAFGTTGLIESLISQGWSIKKANQNGKTPLDFAIFFKNKNTKDFLDFEAGSQTKESDEEQNTEIRIPTENEAEAVTLLEEGPVGNHFVGWERADWIRSIGDEDYPQATKQNSFNTKEVDSKGNTLFHYAAFFGSLNYNLILLRLGWDIVAKNTENKTPFDYALEVGNTRLVDRFNQIFGTNIQKQPSNEEKDTGAIYGEINRKEDLASLEHSEVPFLNNGEEDIDGTFINNLEISDFENSGGVSATGELGFSPVIEKTYDQPSVDSAVLRRSQISEEFVCADCGKSFGEIDRKIKASSCPFCGTEQSERDHEESNVNSSNFSEAAYLNRDSDGVNEPDHPFETLSGSSFFETHLNNNEGPDYHELDGEFLHDDSSFGLDILYSHLEPYLGSSEKGFDEDFAPLEPGADTLLGNNQGEHISDEIDDDTTPNSNEIGHGSDKLEKRSIFDDPPAPFARSSPDFLGNDNKILRTKGKSDSEWKNSKNFDDDLEDWEIFLDEELEESVHDTEEYFYDEDPLETSLTFDYAQRLASSLGNYCRSEQRRHFEFFLNILGDFPYYQSYAAIERLISRGHQVDRISDTYEIKLLWSENPSIWSERYFNKMERAWNVSRNPKIKNSMSWQMACDLVANYPPSELESLILVDWYKEWLDLSIINVNSVSGREPTFNVYARYLHQKRSVNPFSLRPK